MATGTATVRVKKEVVICDRCQRAKSEDAEPLVVSFQGKVQTKNNYAVCKRCADVILNSLSKVQRVRKNAGSVERVGSTARATIEV